MQEVKDFLKDESTLKRVDSCFVMPDPECIGVFLAVDFKKKWAAIVYFNDKDFEVSEDSEDINRYYSQASGGKSDFVLRWKVVLRSGKIDLRERVFRSERERNNFKRIVQGRSNFYGFGSSE